MRPKPTYATAIIHFYDGTFWTKSDEPKVPCGKIHGGKALDKANARYRLTDNLEETTCPICFRVVDEGREEPALRTRSVVSVPSKNPAPREIGLRTSERRRVALRIRATRVRRLMAGALALVALRRKG